MFNERASETCLVSPIIHSVTQRSQALWTRRCKQGDINIDAQVTVAFSCVPSRSPVTSGVQDRETCISRVFKSQSTHASYSGHERPLLTASSLMLLTRCALHLYVDEIPPSFRKPALPCSPCGRGLGKRRGGEWPVPSSESPLSLGPREALPGSVVPHSSFPPHWSPRGQRKSPSPPSLLSVSLPIAPSSFR